MQEFTKNLMQLISVAKQSKVVFMYILSAQITRVLLCVWRKGVARHIIFYFGRFLYNFYVVTQGWR